MNAENQEIILTAEMTPNPNTIKFNVNKTILEKGVADFPEKDKAQGSLLPQKLFDFDFVKGVMIGPNFITVTKSEATEWNEVIAEIADVIKPILNSSDPIIAEDVISDSESSSDEGEIEQKIKAILDKEIRPAVAMDGGDITFHGYDNGIVTLTLRGACSSCPSSVMTLKMGVERRLKEVIPEIKEVVQVNE